MSAKEECWCYYSDTGPKIGNQIKSEYGKPWRVGNVQQPVLTVEVDFEKDTIAFSLNGVSQGIAFQGIKLKSLGPLFPAVSLGGANCSVTIY